MSVVKARGVICAGSFGLTPSGRFKDANGVVGVDDGNRAIKAYLFFRDETGRQQAASLVPSTSHVTIGRGQGTDLHLFWDGEVSRLHAQLEHLGNDWVLGDDGLSRNGTYVNSERLQARHRLRDGDVILVGGTTLTYHATHLPLPGTKDAQSIVSESSLSQTQRQVLQALCRPYTARDAYATPATNQQIADEIHLSVESVKNHLRTLFQKFGVGDLPQNQKRNRLVELAFRSGMVSQRNL